jgi:nitrite reductase/ring-hydroxylating ferredoxin subunit
MGDFIKAAEISDLSDGALKKVIVNGIEILLARVHGQVYATDPLCPHLLADLSEGTLQGTILTCPLHNSQFDVRDGHVVRWTGLSGVVLRYAIKARPPRPLKCYPVRIEGENVLVGLP